MKSIYFKYIPNILTIIRILLLIPIIFFIFWELEEIFNFQINSIRSSIRLNYLLSGVFFIVAAITDALDGFLARKYKWISEFGKIWDPIADKVIINLVLIALAIEKNVPFYIPIILILRDSIVDAYRFNAFQKKIDVSANIWGKVKTIVLFLGILIIFILFNFNNDLLLPNNWQYFILQTGILHIACILSIISGIFYIKNFHCIKN